MPRERERERWERESEKKCGRGICVYNGNLLKLAPHNKVFNNSIIFFSFLFFLLPLSFFRSFFMLFLLPCFLLPPLSLSFFFSWLISFLFLSSFFLCLFLFTSLLSFFHYSSIFRFGFLCFSLFLKLFPTPHLSMSLFVSFILYTLSLSRFFHFLTHLISPMFPPSPLPTTLPLKLISLSLPPVSTSVHSFLTYSFHRSPCWNMNE